MSVFSYTPDYIYTVTPKYTTLVTTYENNKEQRRSKVSASRREFSLEYDHTDETTKDNILAFFDARKGAYGSFDWMCPLNSTTYTVRFKEDFLEIEEVADEVYDMKFNLIEVK